MQPPTEKQIRFAEEIAKVLNIDFPSNAKEYTKSQYYRFISSNIDAYDLVLNGEDWDPEDVDNYTGVYAYYGADDVWGSGLGGY